MELLNQVFMNIYIYISIKWTVYVNVTINSAQYAHARMISIIVEKSPNSIQMYDRGFMDVIPIVKQSKIDFIHKQVIRHLLHGGNHLWLPPWSKGRIN